MMLCASPAYLFTHGEPKTVDDLKLHRAVGYMRFGKMLSWKFLIGDTVAEFIPTARILMDDLQAVLDACLAGLGVAWLPRWLVLDHLGFGKLETLMLDHTAVEFPINAVWPRTPHLLLKTRVAVDALLQKLPARLEGIEACPQSELLPKV